MGYEHWANLAPSVSELQTFGHAEVSEDCALHIKLVGIDGSIKYEKTLGPSPDLLKSTSGASTIISTASAVSADASALPLFL